MPVRPDSPDLWSQFDGFASYCEVILEQETPGGGWRVTMRCDGQPMAITAYSERLLNAVANAINTANEAGWSDGSVSDRAALGPARG